MRRSTPRLSTVRRRALAWAAAWALAGVPALRAQPVPAPAAASALPAALASAPAAALAVRPPKLAATLTLEGVAEPVQLRRVDGALGPLRFGTYVPPDLIVRPRAGAVRFVARFGGVPQPLAWLELALLPPGLDAAQAEALLARQAPAPLQPLAAGEPGRWPWAQAQGRYAYRARSGAQLLGSTALLRRGDRWLRVTLQHPAEYADGFPPRAALVLGHWRWAADGAGL